VKRKANKRTSTDPVFMSVMQLRGNLLHDTEMMDVVGGGYYLVRADRRAGVGAARTTLP